MKPNPSYSDAASRHVAKHEFSDAERAALDFLEHVRSSGKPPTSAVINALATPGIVACVQARLLDILKPHLPISPAPGAHWFMPAPFEPEHAAGLWSHRFRCWQGRDREFVKDVLSKLRKRKDAKAIWARYACGDLRDWRRADRVARALILLKRIVPASMARGQRYG